jgi:hypothetical protein
LPAPRFPPLVVSSLHNSHCTLLLYCSAIHGHFHVSSGTTYLEWHVGRAEPGGDPFRTPAPVGDGFRFTLLGLAEPGRERR